MALMSMNLLSLGLLLVFVIIVRKVRQYRSLCHFAGPRLAAWTRLWLLWANGSGKMNVHFTEVNHRYGTTARIAPHLLITADPDLIKRMNAVRSSFTRSQWYTALRLHPTRENITSITDESLHTDVRNRMSAGYSGKENSHIQTDIDHQLNALFQLIETKYVSDKSVSNSMDLSRIMTYFTLDVISSVAFGIPFGFITSDGDPFGYIANLQQMLPAIILFGVFTELIKLLRLPILAPFLPKTTDKRGLGKVMDFARERVQERFGDDAVKRNDMLGSFISHGLTREQLESETLTQITAGSDSTATALRMTLLHIYTSPRILASLRSEALEAMSQDKITRPIITDAQARHLPYLQACIKEGLRTYPPVTGLLAKQVPPEGAWIDDDKFAPPGTWIAWNSWGMLRDRTIFGEDADIFRPERWLLSGETEDDVAQLAKMTETVGLCFGYGRFGCLGKPVAMMELNKALFEIVHKYDMQLLNIAEPFKETCVGFFLHSDMMVRITKRA